MKKKAKVYTKSVWNKPSKEELHQRADNIYHFDEIRKNHVSCLSKEDSVSKYKKNKDKYDDIARIVLLQYDIESALGGGKAEQIHHIVSRFVFPDGVCDPRNHVPLTYLQHADITNGKIKCFVGEDKMVHFMENGETIKIWNPEEYIKIWNEVKERVEIDS